MLSDWKSLLNSEVADVEEVEKEARELFDELKGRLDNQDLVQAQEMLAKGRELLNIVRVGNGVHNKKYAVNILDGAFANFEDTIELLEETNGSENLATIRQSTVAEGEEMLRRTRYE
ncbi:MAG: hypothetical protein G8D85_11485 [gamma proteobacterium symbiont of Ctena orbiculata]